jgi:hypothetical protein
MEVDQEKVRLEAEAEELADAEMTPEVEARLVSCLSSLLFALCETGLCLDALSVSGPSHPHTLYTHSTTATGIDCIRVCIALPG